MNDKTYLGYDGRVSVSVDEDTDNITIHHDSFRVSFELTEEKARELAGYIANEFGWTMVNNSSADLANEILTERIDRRASNPGGTVPNRLLRARDELEEGGRPL